MPFDFEELEIDGVVKVSPQIFGDERGYFLETFKESAFENSPVPSNFVQDNCSFSEKNVLRGLHFQKPPNVQGKLVRAVQGEIYDVAVDLRSDSSTYGEWVAERLKADVSDMLYVPEGFAHGFCVLSETALVEYKVTKEYAPESEEGLQWNDSELEIDWPVDEPILSDRDEQWPKFNYEIKI
jgi:dTDP-4-dehydrorhamnose 3,5-epimerase